MSAQLRLALCSKIGGGKTAHVFAVAPDRVVKLYKRKTFNGCGTPRERDAVVRAEHNSELRAYATLGRHPALQLNVAACFGPVTVTDVVDEQGMSVGAEYVLDCGLLLERLSGSAFEYTDLPHDYQREVVTFFDALEEVGVKESRDGTIFIPGARGRFTLVDIAMEPVGAALREKLRDHGQLPASVLEQFGDPAA